MDLGNLDKLCGVIDPPWRLIQHIAYRHLPTIKLGAERNALRCVDIRLVIMTTRVHCTNLRRCLLKSPIRYVKNTLDQDLLYVRHAIPAARVTSFSLATCPKSSLLLCSL